MKLQSLAALGSLAVALGAVGLVAPTGAHAADVATQLEVSATVSGHQNASETAGNAYNFMVTAEDASGTATPYTGNVTLTNTDTRAVAQPVATQTIAFDNQSSAVFSMTVTLVPETDFTATASGLTAGTGGFGKVKPGQPTQTVLSPANAAVPVGNAQTYTGENYDAYDNATGAYNAAMDDESIALDGVACPAAGCIPTSAKAHTVTAVSNADGTADTSVYPTTLTGVPVNFSLSAPASVPAGSPETVTLNAKPQSGATPYTGTVHFTSSDPKASLPANYTFTAADAGSKAFAVTLPTIGSKTITATDINASSLTSAATTVATGPPATLSLSPAKSSTTAGSPITYTATGTDAAGDSLGNVTGAAHFTIAPDGTCTGNVCTAAAAGVHTVSATEGAVVATAELDVTALTPVLTVKSSKAAIDYGQKVTLSGTLTLNGVPQAGQTVLLTSTYTGDKAKGIGKATTGSNGSWSFTTSPAYNDTVTATALGKAATTKVAVRETYKNLKVKVNEVTVTITGQLLPGFNPTSHTKLVYVVTASARGKRTVTVKAPQRKGSALTNHGYTPLNVSFNLPVGHYHVTLTVTGTPSSTAAASKQLFVTIAEPKVLA